jgi:hypothetical protein
MNQISRIQVPRQGLKYSFLKEMAPGRNRRPSILVRLKRRLRKA